MKPEIQKILRLAQQMRDTASTIHHMTGDKDVYAQNKMRLWAEELEASCANLNWACDEALKDLHESAKELKTILDMY